MLAAGKLLFMLGLMAAGRSGNPEGIPIDAPGGDLPVQVVTVPVGQTPDVGGPLENAPPGTALPPSNPDQPPPRGRVTYVPITSSSFDKRATIDEHPTSSAFDAEDKIDAHPVP